MSKKEKNNKKVHKEEQDQPYGKSQLKKVAGGQEKRQEAVPHLYHSSTCCRGK